jgi:hypothetical protein
MPPLFRYLDAQYVDAFFEDGSLRLSSFAQFAKHKDEARHDPVEGQAMFVNRTTEGTGQTLTAVTKHGANAYVLSTSTRYDADLMHAFNTNSCFVIQDSLNFGVAVARSVPGLQAGLEGVCVYRDTKIVEGNLPQVDLEAYRDPASGLIRIDLLTAAINSDMGAIPFFVKDKTYAYQSEYRMVWLTDVPVQDHLEVRVPSARQFCRRASDLTK